MNIYHTCPTLESEKIIVRLFQDEDCDDLLKVYSDKNALPFFNSDNCDGDNFYYHIKGVKLNDNRSQILLKNRKHKKTR